MSDKFKSTCQELGIPLAEEKVEGPATSLTFLGVVLDTKMGIQLAEEKLPHIQHELLRWLRKKVTKHNILSLVDLL